MSIIDRVRESDVGRSIFRSPDRVTERDRAAGHWSNFLLHIYPVKVRRKEITFRYTWFLGIISLTLFGSLVVSGIYLMFFYVPSPASAYGNIQSLQTEVAFGRLRFAEPGVYHLVLRPADRQRGHAARGGAGEVRGCERRGQARGASRARAP